jgi:hypothetical protein
MGEGNHGGGAGLGNAGERAWAALEGAVRMACMFATAEKRRTTCARLRKLADEIEADAIPDARDARDVGFGGFNVGGRR